MKRLTLSAGEIAEIRQIFENHPISFSIEHERSAAVLLEKLAPVVELTDEEAHILAAHIDHYEHVIGTTVGDHLLDRLPSSRGDSAQLGPMNGRFSPSPALDTPIRSRPVHANM